MRLAVLVFVAACAPPATRITAQHPASPASEPGRLAGPPAALRPGVADPATPPAAQPARLEAPKPPPPPPHQHP